MGEADDDNVISTGPLHGIRFIELISADCSAAVRLSLAFAGRVACDLGAEVRIVLDPGATDPLEQVAPFVRGHSTVSWFLNANKQTLHLSDAKSELRRADVIASDGAISSERRSLAPTAIWLVSSLFAAEADASVGANTEFTVMARAGLLDLVGEPQREPLRLGGHQLAHSAGLALYAGMAAALCAREAGGPAQTVRVNLFDVAVWLNWKGVVLASWTDASVSRRGRNAEWCTLKCADGWVALVYLEADWPKLRELVDDPRLFEPRFDDRAESRRNAAYINEVIEGALQRFSRSQLREIALSKRIPLGPIWSPDELEQDPHNQARDFLRRTPLQEGGSILLPRLPALWNGQAFERAAAVPQGAS